MGLVSELRRRNVFRMLVLYVVAAWLIMQVAEVLSALLPGFLPERFGQVTLGILAVGFPIALILSWFYEITPEGVSLEKDVDAGESITHITGRRLDFIVISLLSAAVVLFAVHTWWIPEPPDRSVAVLPFVPMSSGEDDGYFADGLTEEILNSLAQLPDLQVTARTSSFFFKDKDIPVPEIANLLSVAHIVEGSVRRDGERVRVTSQLIRAADGYHLWSQTYDRASKDIFAVQQDIAEKVAEALDVALDNEARERMSAMRITDVEAFIAYQKGVDLYEKAHSWDLPLFEGLAAANEYFDKALEAQPGLVFARARRADWAGHLLHKMIESAEPDIDKVKAQAEAYKTEFDLAWRSIPNGNQRDILNLARTMTSDDWTGLASLIQKAMQPGNCPKGSFPLAIASLGFAEDVAGKLEESLACDPLDAATVFTLAETYSIAGRPDEALELIDRAEAMGVNSWRIVNYARRTALTVAGRFDHPLQQWDLKDSEWLWNLYQGNHAEARQVAEQIWADPERGPMFSLNVAASVGDRARANEFAACIDRFPGSAILLLGSLRVCWEWGRAGIAKGCRQGVPFDLEATPNFKARIEESGLPWPPVAFQDISTEAL